MQENKSVFSGGDRFYFKILPVSEAWSLSGTLMSDSVLPSVLIPRVQLVQQHLLMQ